MHTATCLLIYCPLICQCFSFTLESCNTTICPALSVLHKGTVQRVNEQCGWNEKRGLRTSDRELWAPFWVYLKPLRADFLPLLHPGDAGFRLAHCLAYKWRHSSWNPRLIIRRLDEAGHAWGREAAKQRWGSSDRLTKGREDNQH